jgi:transposase-like protein
MQPISYARHQFPAEFIQHAVWLYLRFTLSYCDVEELLAERGIETSYETVRRWVLKFGSASPTTASAAAETDGHVAPGRNGDTVGEFP